MFMVSPIAGKPVLRWYATQMLHLEHLRAQCERVVSRRANRTSSTPFTRTENQAAAEPRQKSSCGENYFRLNEPPPWE